MLYSPRASVVAVRVSLLMEIELRTMVTHAPGIGLVVPTDESYTVPTMVTYQVPGGAVGVGVKVFAGATTCAWATWRFYRVLINTPSIQPNGLDITIVGKRMLERGLEFKDGITGKESHSPLVVCFSSKMPQPTMLESVL